ncbi:MAG: long-chain fatty acid--CoA ligase [Thermoleophilia bacterium]|nr:long-chain fatty acid--CoA ligase [Thermoleophilia bacterium]
MHALAPSPPAECLRSQQMRRRTIGSLWRDGAAAGHPEPAYLTRQGETWTPVTWAEADERVRLLAHGLLARGVRKGDAIGILARTTLEWALFDFALATIGAVTAPIYATSSAKDAAFVLAHSESVGVLLEDDEQRAKIVQERPSLPLLRDPLVLTFAGLAALEAAGRAHRERQPAAVAEAEAAISEDDLYTFIYTSGTTGPPKGCRILHRNYWEMATVVEQMPQYFTGDDCCLLFLPLAHNFGRLTHLTGPLTGQTIAFEPDPYAVAEALLQVRPTVFPSVPRIYEKIHSGIVSAFAEATGPKRKLIDWALAVGREVGPLRREGKPVPTRLALRHRVADLLVYSKVKARLGGRLRLPISGGAPLGFEVAELFDALDIRIMEGYGLTECTTAATLNTPIAYRYGTVGQALPGFELRLDDDGELLVRSATVFDGYHRDPEATAEVLDADGWLRTGDIASIDADGFVTITDRKKDILVTAGGKNVSPQNLENDLKASRWVSQAIVVGDRRPYVAALLTLDPIEIGKWAAERSLAPDVAALAREPAVHTLLQAVVDGVNADRSRFEQIKRFAILPRDLELTRGELTPTLKVRRKICLETFAAAAERLYAEE